MKHLFTLFALLLNFAAFSQRTTDLDVKIVAPTTPFSIDTNETFDLEVMVTNLGPDDITASDSLFFYMIIDGDTMQFPPQGNYEVYVNAIASGATFTITKTMAFNGSFDGSSMALCAAVHPMNAASPITDSEEGNNKSCIAVQVGEQSTAGLNNNQKIAFTLFPNPASDKLFLDSKYEFSAVSVLDISGKKLADLIQSNGAIDCSSLPEGFYYIVVETKDGRATEKFAVSRN